MIEPQAPYPLNYRVGPMGHIMNRNVLSHRAGANLSLCRGQHLVRTFLPEKGEKKKGRKREQEIIVVVVVFFKLNEERFVGGKFG